MSAPIVKDHQGILVVRDDLYPGGTKARYLMRLFDKSDELVYASPAEGGAQTALAHCAKALGKRAVIFVAKRKEPHARARMAKALGARVFQVSPGYLAVVQARARAYCEEFGALLVPFGADLPEAVETIASAAMATGLKPDEVWCASGSGVLVRGLAKAWPGARMNAVQVGRVLSVNDVGGASIHTTRYDFGQEGPAAPFPADLHYDAKAWEIAKARRGAGCVVFWNVTGPATA